MRKYLKALTVAASLAISSFGSAHAETVGVAWLEADGTIVLQLRAESSNGIVGESVVKYAPDDSCYRVLKQHIGKIPENGTVSVRPFSTEPEDVDPLGCAD
ncbi:hypothetical protein FPY71_07615 [Aureimonas fodinaquatilis]|uniref:Uncharacterized protein n=1 Tax=Aureimonas fodinaquatilis TaxID=2565783 RepID=A0A5B0DVJ8_9HYPH|nr:hypothetical protein [Aureimonas fodinaquatilis]KAA0970378.1 hypothetical protein FPY71_07615 [Aureimonas fodinaquatilis]